MIDSQNSGYFPFDHLINNKQWVYNKYINERKTCREIGVEAGCAGTTVSVRLKKYNIKVRHPREWIWSGKNNPNWKGGRCYHKGYVLIKDSTHPRAHKSGYVKEHILVWEKFHRKPLPEKWIIHHLNGIRDDNRIENLQAMPNRRHTGIIGMYKKRILELEKELFEARLGR